MITLYLFRFYIFCHLDIFCSHYFHSKYYSTELIHHRIGTCLWSYYDLTHQNLQTNEEIQTNIEREWISGGLRGVRRDSAVGDEALIEDE